MRSKIFGILLLIESAFLFLSAGVSAYYRFKCGDTDFQALLYPAIAAFAVGIVLYLIGTFWPKPLSMRDNFIITSVTWIIFTLFGMFPFLIYGTFDNITDSWFEAMAGFTTTGCTTIENVDAQPHGILFWRSIMQWLGGLGIIVFSLAFVPSVGKSSKRMALFASESTGVSVDKIHPKMQKTAIRLWAVYLLLTFLCTIAYWIGPMNIFDAVCHSMTTIATGGYSTHQSSIGYWNSTYLEYVCAIFMFASGISFALYYLALTGKAKSLIKSEETRAYIKATLISIGVFILMFYLIPLIGGENETLPKGFKDIFRTSFFHVSAIISSTALQSVNFDYESWGVAFVVPTLVLMFSGACAGSTSGGVKIIREIICIKHVRETFRCLLHPNSLYSVKISDNPVSESIVSKVLAFIYLYIFLMLIVVVALISTGMPFADSIISYISCMSNCGPGIGIIGPSHTYTAVPAAAKWILTFVMLVGRLEIFTIIMLFTRSFWKDTAN